LKARWFGVAVAAVAAGVLVATMFATMAEAQSPGAGAEQGRSLFEARCGMCHLAGGTGTFMLGRRLGPANALLAERTNLDATYVKHVVRNGIVSMPRITRAEVSDAELQAIAGYLTRKQGREQRASGQSASGRSASGRSASGQGSTRPRASESK
jgi:mono/diheme cytochrome c family protein